MNTDLLTSQLVNDIRSGSLDNQIKQIARACIERRDVLKESDDAAFSDPLGLIRYIEDLESHQPRQTKPQSRPMPAQLDATPPARTTGAKPRGRRRFGGNSTTFRYTDGKLYQKSDIIGATLNLPGVGYRARVIGIGERAVKVEFIDTRGHKVEPPGSDGNLRKPFVALSAINDIVAKMTPIYEGV